MSTTTVEPHYLFVSFDLCNASAFKYSHSGWIQLYQRAFQLLEEEMSRSPKWNFWKANGDELLYYLEVPGLHQVAGQIERIDNVHRHVLPVLYKEHDDAYADIRQLSIKATAWLAQVYDPNVAREKASGDYLVTWSDKVDFTGVETDIGFRIAKYAPRSKTALSAYLTYLLAKQHSPVLQHVRIAGYMKLKGVWLEKSYPIIWYIRATDSESILRSFHYDEDEQNPLIRPFTSSLRSDVAFGKIELSEFGNVLSYLGLKTGYDRALSIPKEAE
jgi:hypothetical protein